MMGCSECYGSFVEQGKLELIALWGCSECYGGFVEQGKLESFVRAF
jgi:protein-arginine kinase activator protein McsA